LSVAVTLRAKFLEDGCLKIPGALSEDCLNRAEAAWCWSMENPGPASARLLTDDILRVSGEDAARALDVAESGFFYQDIGHPEALPVYQDVILHPDIVAILKAVLDADISTEAWFLGEQIFLKEANSPSTGWHQDRSDISAAGDDMIVLWISFDEVPEAGGLEVVAGSHAGTTYSSIYGVYRSEDIPLVTENTHDVRRFDSQRGDVVVFHMGTLHGGGATQDFARRTLALRFVGPDCYFQSRATDDDPRNGSPYRPGGLKVLPI